VPAGDHLAEVDVFHGPLDGLRIVEVEFDDRGAADAFTAPGWFGEEVTGRPEWNNLALPPRPPRPAPATTPGWARTARLGG